MPVPPSKKRLLQIDRSLVDGGELKEGVPYVAVKVARYQNGARVEIEVQGHKFPLAEICLSLLNAHEEFMRLHSDSEIAEMSSKDVLNVLQISTYFHAGTVPELRPTPAPQRHTDRGASTGTNKTRPSE